MERMEGLWNGVLFSVNPSVLKPAVYGLGAILELSLDPLDVAKTRAIGKCGKHAGWYEIGNIVAIRGIFLPSSNLLIDQKEFEKIKLFLSYSERNGYL